MNLCKISFIVFSKNCPLAHLPSLIVIIKKQECANVCRGKK